jgi:hypothetical protein
MILKKTIFTIILFYSLTVIAQGQIRVTPLDTIKLPVGIKYKGKIHDAVQWTDKLGLNVVITTETGTYPIKSADSDGLWGAELFAYHYIITNDSAKEMWKVYDFIKPCALDIYAKFKKNAFQITDLNNDNIAEIWLMYNVECRSDIGPNEMKIIMYQGQQKYAMRGQDKVKITENQYEGGEYTFDKAFVNAPEEFREYAKKLWDKNMMQTWD